MQPSWWKRLGKEKIKYMSKTLFSCGTQQVVPSKQDSAMLPAHVANYSTGFGSSCKAECWSGLEHKPPTSLALYQLS